jgi:hypothetical protein
MRADRDRDRGRGEQGRRILEEIRTVRIVKRERKSCPHPL